MHSIGVFEKKVIGSVIIPERKNRKVEEDIAANIMELSDSSSGRMRSRLFFL